MTAQLALPASISVIPSLDANWNRLKALVVDSISARSSKRLYAMALDGFYTWYFAEPRAPFSRAVVQEYRTVLEHRGYAPSTIALYVSAIRKLAAEAADNGLLNQQVAASVCRIRGPRRLGRRLGHWLSASQAATLIQTPEKETLKGVRDQAILAMAVGCGLRRSEIASLMISHLQVRDGRWVIADLIGKSGRIRTVPIPVWTKSRLDIWLGRANVTANRVFRSPTKPMLSLAKA